MASHAFQPPSVGLWVVNPANLSDRLPRIAALWGGLVSDVFVSGAASRSQADAIRATVRPNGTKLRAQLWAAANNLPVASYADQVVADSKRLDVGVADLNIEVPDAKLADYIRDAVSLIRAERPTFKLRVDVAPYKGFGLTGLAFAGDGNLYACEQAYYGDMSPVTADEALADLLDHGVPRARAAIAYGAAGPIGWVAPGVPWSTTRHFTIGTLYFNGQLVRGIRHGLIFQDDLLAEVGQL
jgi:hypothetical protein